MKLCWLICSIVDLDIGFTTFVVSIVAPTLDSLHCDKIKAG